MKQVVGIINLQEGNSLIRELAATRAVEALPFAGRYRLVDFAISNMVNSGISAVGLLLPDFSRAASTISAPVKIGIWLVVVTA